MEREHRNLALIVATMVTVCSFVGWLFTMNTAGPRVFVSGESLVGRLHQGFCWLTLIAGLLTLYFGAIKPKKEPPLPNKSDNTGGIPNG